MLQVFKVIVERSKMAGGIKPLLKSYLKDKGGEGFFTEHAFAIIISVGLGIIVLGLLTGAFPAIINSVIKIITDGLANTSITGS